MAEDFAEVRRNISLFFLSLRQSVDRPFRGRAPVDSGERQRFMKTMLIIEEARLKFSTYTRYREEPTQTGWSLARDELLDFVKYFVHSPDIEASTFNQRFLIAPLMTRDKENPTSFMQRIITDRENRISISDALVIFSSYLNEASVQQPVTQETLSFEELNRIVPRQQVAPVQFDIVKDKIVVVKRTPVKLDEDNNNIASSLDYIKKAGDQLAESLEQSNCDRRLLESVQQLQQQLIEDGSIVKIGLTNMACGVMCAQFNTELPDAIAAMFNSFSTSVSLYVAQFPEWEQFTQKAALIDLDEDDVAEVDIATGELLSALAANPQLTDPEVPKTIAFVRQFLAFPGPASKRAAFAMIRTIENLLSSIIRHSVSFVSQTAEKTVSSASSTASKVIVGLLGVALVSAVGIGPAAMRAGAPWVKQAAEVVQKQIEKAAE
jgi:hypothetical protein